MIQDDLRTAEEITCQELRKATDRYPFDDGEILESFSFFTGHRDHVIFSIWVRLLLSERRGLACRWSEDTIVFPLKAFDQILDDIEFCAEMLSTNFYDHSLDGWKKRFTGLGTVDYLNLQKEPDELELYEKLDLILDFYERLVYRLRIMVKDAGECGYILFLACVFVQKREEFKY